MKSKQVQWRYNTPALLKEIGSNNEMAVMRQPLMIFASILAEVATRASQLNDPEMNKLMAKLALYEITDPYSKDYDKVKANKLIKTGTI